MQTTMLEKKILTVSELNRSVKRLLEQHFRIIWIEGEISNLSKPQSGHLYFTLKDKEAQVRCAMFRRSQFSPNFQLDNGMHVLAAAKISLYEGRGDYQLIVEHIEEQGEGLLRRRFEQLKNQLAAEGIFDLIHKKPMPAFPKCIGVITSATGAAIKDVISVLNRRFPAIPVIIYPTAVQGELAPAQIVKALKIANQRRECDVLIICRGGGSLEDLFAFNEEIVARAIFQSEIPIVSGVGHEIDITICDFVADQRAPTPSAAAELLSPDQNEFKQQALFLFNRLSHLINIEFKQCKMRIDNLKNRILHPQQILEKYSQNIDILEQCLRRALALKYDQIKNQINSLSTSLHHLNPIKYFAEKRHKINSAEAILNHLIKYKIENSKAKLSSLMRTLSTVSPLNTLERGYSITSKGSHIIEDVKQLAVKDEIQIQIKNGVIKCDVIELIEK